MPNRIEPPSWQSVLAAARNAREKSVVGRLAGHCAACGFGPEFGAAARDALLADLDGKISNPQLLINAALKSMVAIATRHPELALSVCPRIPTPKDVKHEERRTCCGVPFEAGIAAYVIAANAPADAHGRARRVFPSIAEKHPNALRRCARLCKEAGVEIVTIGDLLSEEARDAIIEAYGSSDQASGGRKALLKVLIQVARHLGNFDALADIRRQVTHMPKPSDAMSLDRLENLSAFHNVARRDDLLAGIATVAAELVAGWPRVWALRRVQASFAVLLGYYLVATPGMVWSLSFDTKGVSRDTPWGPRPLLVARLAPDEPIEAALSAKLLAMIDLYWAQMPKTLRAAGEFFVTDDGERTTKTAFAKRLHILLAELDIALPPTGFVDLAVLDMVWDGSMSSDAMAVKCRFQSTAAFTKRYSILIDDVRTQKRRNPKRPGSGRTA